MHKHIVDAPNVISRIIFISVLRFIGAQPVKKANLANNDWFFGLQECFANPAENGVSLKKPLRAGGNHRSSAANWAVRDLLILPQRTNAAPFVALGGSLKRTRNTDDRVCFAFNCCALKSFCRRQGVKPGSIPLADRIAIADVRLLLCHALRAYIEPPALRKRKHKDQLPHRLHPQHGVAREFRTSL